MWRPGNVVKEHRTRATLVWGGILLAILGYIVWQIITIIDKRSNPSTSFSVSDDPYPFPPMMVCLWDGQGCDEALGSSICMGTVLFTVYDSCYEAVSTDEEPRDINIPTQYPNCVAFDLGLLNMEGFENGCVEGAAFRKPTMSISMAWIESIAPSEEAFITENIGIFLGNGSTEEFSRVPYSRVVSTPETTMDATNFINTYFTIGKNVRNFISGESTSSFPILTLSTVDVLDQTSTVNNTTAGSNSTYAYSFAHITLTQSSYSLSELTDIDPFDPAALLGNIGGFWEILLVTWGLCFIATREQAPTQRGRDFSQPLQKGREIVARKRRSFPTVYSGSECHGEDERPHWEHAARRPQHGASGVSIRGIPSVNDGSVGGAPSVNDSSAGGRARQQRGSRHRINVPASFFRQPVPQDHPRRSFSQSGRSAATAEISAPSGHSRATTHNNRPPSYADCA